MKAHLVKQYCCFKIFPLNIIPLSTTKGALGPISIATAPAPPEGRALPAAYTAISAQTTMASRPEVQNHN